MEHAQWEHELIECHKYTCSNCKFGVIDSIEANIKIPIYVCNYCPNCGAKMDEGNK